MGRKICCNPSGYHKQQVSKNIRPSPPALVGAGLVGEGDMICHYCRVKLLEKLKPEKPKPHDSSDTEAEETLCASTSAEEKHCGGDSEL